MTIGGEQTGETKKDARTELAVRLEQKAIREARQGLLSFTKYTFGPEYEVNWHHRLICRALDKFVAGEIDRLILNCPFRHGKTELCSRRLPAYILGKDPDANIIATSYGADLAEDNSVDVKNIIQSEQYQRVFPETRLPTKSESEAEGSTEYRRNRKDIWEIAEHDGRYLAKGVGGGITGKGGDFLLVDDPIKDYEEARSKKERDRVWSWFNKVLRTRASRNGRILVIQTRWHQDDLVGRLEREMENVDQAKDWTILNFPVIYRESVTGLHPEDPREPGEALWPWFMERGEWLALEESDPEGFAALGQGEPAPPGGEILHKNWIESNYWTELPPPPHTWIWVLDPKGGSEDQRSSEAVVQLWVKSQKEPANAYLVAQQKGIWSQGDTEDRLEELAGRQPWKQADTVVIENKGDGPGIKDHLKHTVPGIVMVDPWAGKEQRLRDVESFWRAGNVRVPCPGTEDRKPAPVDTSWVKNFKTQHTSFPGSQKDDQVDASTYAIDYLLGSRGTTSPGEGQHYLEKFYG